MTRDLPIIGARTIRLAYVLTQDRGGPVDVTTGLAAGFARDRGYEVRLFGPRPARSAERVAALLTEVAVGGKTATAAIRQARREIVAWRPDLVHAQDRRSGLVCVRLGPPVVHTYHGVPEDVSPQWLATGDPPAPSRYSRAVLAADAAVARAVAATVVVTPALRDFLTGRLRVPPSRVVQIDNGLDLPAARPAPERVRRLLFVGLLGRVKGVDLLLQALRRAIDAGLPDDVHLDLAGDGDLADALRGQAAMFGLADRVSWLGFRDDVPDLLHRCDALVLPSRLEQQPLVLIEAKAAGLPVLATSVGGVPDLLGEVGDLVPPGDPEALAAALLRLCTATPDDLRRRSEAGVTRARDRFSLERCVAAHDTLYRRVLGPRLL